jgi:hypothetical protein
MQTHSRALQFDSLEGRQLLSVAPAPAAPAPHPPVPHNALLADIQFDLGYLAKQQLLVKRDVARVNGIQSDLTLDGRQLMLAEGKFAADETALLANLQLPATKTVLAAREADFKAVAADTVVIKVLQKDIATDTVNLAVAKVAETKDVAIVAAIQTDITADIKAL